MFSNLKSAVFGSTNGALPAGVHGPAPSPASVDPFQLTSYDVEQLIHQLYSPANKQNYTQLNDRLVQLQRSPAAWELADDLLRSVDVNVRFYAAQTFIVKINNDGPSLDAETAETVRLRLVVWLVRMSQFGEKEMVLRKICAALSAYFVRSSVQWRQPMKDVAVLLATPPGQAQATVTTDSMSMLDAIQALPEQELTGLLYFAGTLAEEASKLPARQQAYARHHAELVAGLNDTAIMIAYGFKDNSDYVKEQTLEVYASWLGYAAEVRPDAEALEPLRALLGPVTDCLRVENIAGDALHILRDRLDCYPDFFLPEHMELLTKVIVDYVGPQLYRALADQDSDVSTQMVQFIVAFGCANIQQVIENPDHELGSKIVLKILMDILATEGIPGDDDQLSIHTIEFWNTYIEYINDTVYSLDPHDEPPAWVAYAKQVLSQTVELLWKKLWIPPAGKSKSWTDEEHDAFKEFRLDSTDLMLSIFAFLGKGMLHQLVSYALQSLEAKRWRSVEGALFSLNTLSDNVLEDGTGEDAIEALFRSDLFVQIADFHQVISSQTRRTAIDTLGSYGQYIERHPEFLPPAVRFLFASLEMGGLANVAAKSIDSLCSACRSNLTSEIPGFLEQYQRFLQSPTNDPYTKQKVIGGIAAIIQALTPESAKAEPLLALISNVEQDVEAAKRYAEDDDRDMVELIGISALECLTHIGKGMQVPDDVPINIYDDDEDPAGSPDNFWLCEEGQAVQKRIVACLSVLQVVGNYSEAVDAACQVLRSGFAETQPGPFVFPPGVTINFLGICTVNTPQLEAVLGTASMLITSSSRRGFMLADDDALSLYNTVAGFIQVLERSSNDPAVAAGCIEVLTRLMPSYSHILVQNITEAVLLFTLTAIESNETFPKRAACGFWTKLIKPQTEAIPEESKERIGQVMQSFGPNFVFSLVQQFGGHANRSDLDILCEPLKALLLHQSGTQTWLQQALSDQRFASQQVPMEGRGTFVQALLRARSDGKMVKEVVRRFWAACRGTVTSFAS